MDSTQQNRLIITLPKKRVWLYVHCAAAIFILGISFLINTILRSLQEGSSILDFLVSDTGGLFLYVYILLISPNHLAIIFGSIYATLKLHTLKSWIIFVISMLLGGLLFDSFLNISYLFSGNFFAWLLYDVGFRTILFLIPLLLVIIGLVLLIQYVKKTSHLPSVSVGILLPLLTMGLAFTLVSSIYVNTDQIIEDQSSQYQYYLHRGWPFVTSGVSEDKTSPLFPIVKIGLFHQSYEDQAVYVRIIHAWRMVATIFIYAFGLILPVIGFTTLRSRPYRSLIVTSYLLWLAAIISYWGQQF